MAETKAMTVRLAHEQADMLEAVAMADGISVAEAIRTAIGAYIQARTTEPELQDKLREAQRRLQQTIERLQPSLPDQLADYRERHGAYLEQICPRRHGDG